MLLCIILTNLIIFHTTTPPPNFLIHNTNQLTNHYTYFFHHTYQSMYSTTCQPLCQLPYQPMHQPIKPSNVPVSILTEVIPQMGTHLICSKTIQDLCPKNSVIKIVDCNGIIGNRKYFILQFTNNKISFHHYISKSNTKIALSNSLVEGNSSISNDTSVFIQNTNNGGFTGEFGMFCAIFVDDLWYLSVILELTMLETNLFLIKCLCISKKK